MTWRSLCSQRAVLRARFPIRTHALRRCTERQQPHSPTPGRLCVCSCSHSLAAHAICQVLVELHGSCKQLVHDQGQRVRVGSSADIQAAGDLAPWCFKQSGVGHCTGGMRGPTSNTPRPWPTRRSCDTYSATSLTALDWSASSCPSAAQKPGRHINPIAWVTPSNSNSRMHVRQLCCVALPTLSARCGQHEKSPGKAAHQ